MTPREAARIAGWIAALMVMIGAMRTAFAVDPDTRRSGAEFMGESTRAIQLDDTQNPGMLWVSGGEALWNTQVGEKARSCADCHGDASTSMRGVATRYPAFHDASGRVLNLGQRINLCREGAQQAPPLQPESEDLLGIESYVALQSRGMTVTPAQDAGTRDAAGKGRRFYFQRIGQLNLSCAQCHDDNWGGKLGSAMIPQGHATAYPTYRLEWQSMGSLQRRLRNCMSGVRAEVPRYGARELVELETYLAVRAEGMMLETPGVRP